MTKSLLTFAAIAFIGIGISTSAPDAQAQHKPPTTGKAGCLVKCQKITVKAAEKCFSECGKKDKCPKNAKFDAQSTASKSCESCMKDCTAPALAEAGECTMKC